MAPPTVGGNRRAFPPPVAIAFPSLAEIVRYGNSWGARLATAVAAVTSLPTTAAQHVMHNGETASSQSAGASKSYIIDRIILQAAATITDPDGGITLLAQMTRGTLAAPSSPSTVVVNTLSGSATAYPGNATFKNAVTLADDRGWYALPLLPSSGTATANASFVCEVDGRIIIPPGCMLSLAVMSVDTGGTFIPTFLWHEVRLPVNNG